MRWAIVFLVFAAVDAAVLRIKRQIASYSPIELPGEYSPYNHPADISPVAPVNPFLHNFGFGLNVNPGDRFGFNGDISLPYIDKDTGRYYPVDIKGGFKAGPEDFAIKFGETANPTNPFKVPISDLYLCLLSDKYCDGDGKPRADISETERLNLIQQAQKGGLRADTRQGTRGRGAPHGQLPPYENRYPADGQNLPYHLDDGPRQLAAADMTGRRGQLQLQDGPSQMQHGKPHNPAGLPPNAGDYSQRFSKNYVPQLTGAHQEASAVARDPLESEDLSVLHTKPRKENKKSAPTESIAAKKLKSIRESLPFKIGKKFRFRVRTTTPAPTEPTTTTTPDLTDDGADGLEEGAEQPMADEYYHDGEYPAGDYEDYYQTEDVPSTGAEPILDNSDTGDPQNDEYSEPGANPSYDYYGNAQEGSFLPSDLAGLSEDDLLALKQGLQAGLNPFDFIGAGTDPTSDLLSMPVQLPSAPRSPMVSQRQNARKPTDPRVRNPVSPARPRGRFISIR